ncbi:MAG: Clp protease ClpP [Phenylobacterium sp.]|uniref:head maturation protease, ClpP-related n=1 Tax=Phenylobacterium sp. TaxID=1871053 RepID=UPI002736EF26|nr:head maturation protease, ClpP-related [Phenylobacterium sp.]MDP3117225.1 Clp protease ClpP [Phenylobacterium sp.]
MAVQILDGELILSGMVGDDFWGDGFTSGQVIAALAQIGRNADVTVRLNSGGGIATEGAAIHAALASHKGAVTVIVEGIAASAASLIACAGDVVEMALGSVFMIHDPATITWGTAADHQLAIQMLDSLATSYADTYAEKTGDPTATMRSLMKAETWMTAQEAVDRKFADRLASANDNADQAEPSAFAYALYGKTPDRIAAHASAKGWKAPAGASLKPAAASAPAKPAPNSASPQATPVASHPPAAPAAQPAQQEPPMADTPNETEIRAKATSEAQARIQAILTSDEAADRAEMAQHLAFSTAHSAEDAIALMKVAPKAAPAAEPEADPTAQFIQRKSTAQDGLGGPAGKPGAQDARASWKGVTDRVNKRVSGGR